MTTEHLSKYAIAERAPKHILETYNWLFFNSELLTIYENAIFPTLKSKIKSPAFLILLLQNYALWIGVYLLTSMFSAVFIPETYWKESLQDVEGHWVQYIVWNLFRISFFYF